MDSRLRPVTALKLKNLMEASRVQGFGVPLEPASCWQHAISTVAVVAHACIVAHGLLPITYAVSMALYHAETTAGLKLEVCMRVLALRQHDFSLTGHD